MTSLKIPGMPIVWIDVETTGLNLHANDKLLQVACIVTDSQLNEVSEGFEMEVFYNQKTVDKIYEETNEYVQKMHSATGLWSKLPKGTSMDTVDLKLTEFISNYVEAKSAILGGNSIFLDRTALMLNLPTAFEYIHYQSYDMSTVAHFFKNNLNTPLFEKKKTHAALDDIRESIAESRYYSNILKTL